jgi:hypothetical protein
MTHLAPPVIYIDSPLSFLAEGKARAFYQGIAGLNTNKYEDPTVINYYVIEPRYEALHDEGGSPIGRKLNVINTGLQADNQSESESDFSEALHVHHGTRLVGLIPCSDAFGVDVLADKYATKIEGRRASVKKMDELHRSLRRGEPGFSDQLLGEGGSRDGFKVFDI